MDHSAPLTSRLLMLLTTLLLASVAFAQHDDAKTEEDEKPEQRGLVVNEGGAAPGYTLISPFSLETSMLVDGEGRVVKEWESRYSPGIAYILPNGNVLRGCRVEVPTHFGAGGILGGIQEFDWDGNLVWEYHLANDMAFFHHDIEPLPNGNLLAIAWEHKTREEALAAGRLESHAGEDGLWPCVIFEIEPLRPYGARIVWEWHSWDHLIQDVDPAKPNYGVVAEHPERIDVNGDITRERDEDPETDDEDSVAEADDKVDSGAGMSAAERRRLIALGYLSPDDGNDDADDDTKSDDGDGDGDGKDEEKLSPREKRNRERADWMHMNAVEYNAELDQIVLSSWHFSEIWILDHGTTTEEAASRSGGKRGRGGDLLYRWGNPQCYDRGTVKDRRLFHQHDPQWIPEGYPGAGNMTIFNNGRRRPDEEYSSVLELELPLRSDGTYEIGRDTPFGPAEPTWEYAGTEDDRFYASFISGTHRLANGNTLVCSGPQGRVFEVTRDGDIVWDFLNPFGKIPDDGEPNDFTYGMFRATRFAPDVAPLRGRTLEPIDPQPKTGAELYAERPKPGDRPSGWRPLADEDMGLALWTNVNCDPASTFRMIPDPDDEKKQILKCTGKPTGVLRTTRMFENFVAEFEWRHMEDPGNAGFFIWSDPLPAVGGPFTRSIEIQICNLGNGDWFTSHGDIFPIWGATMTPDPRFRISGSRSMPNEDAFHVRDTGEWNHYRITAIDGTVTLEVNGNLVTAGSGCSPSKGYLCIESEGGEVHFRDMKIWELPAGTHAADAARTANEATDHETLYNGVDLEAWDIESGEWQSEDWRLTCAGEGTITIDLPKGADDLFLDFKRSDAPNGRMFPFALGDRRFKAHGEAPGKWNRVHIRLDETSIHLSCGTAKHTVARGTEPTDVLSLVTDGAPTEFCSIFSNGKHD